MPFFNDSIGSLILGLVKNSGANNFELEINDPTVKKNSLAKM